MPHIGQSPELHFEELRRAGCKQVYTERAFVAPRAAVSSRLVTSGQKRAGPAFVKACWRGCREPTFRSRPGGTGGATFNAD